MGYVNTVIQITLTPAKSMIVLVMSRLFHQSYFYISFSPPIFKEDFVVLSIYLGRNDEGGLRDKNFVWKLYGWNSKYELESGLYPRHHNRFCNTVLIKKIVKQYFVFTIS